MEAVAVAVDVIFSEVPRISQRLSSAADSRTRYAFLTTQSLSLRMKETKSRSSTRSSPSTSIMSSTLRASSSVRKTSILLARSIISSSDRMASFFTLIVLNTWIIVRFSRILLRPMFECAVMLPAPSTPRLGLDTPAESLAAALENPPAVEEGFEEVESSFTRIFSAARSSS